MQIVSGRFFCLCSRSFLQKLLSVFGWCDAVLLFEIPDELGGIGIAYGFTDIIQFQVSGLQKLLRPVQLEFPQYGGKRSFTTAFEQPAQIRFAVAKMLRKTFQRDGLIIFKHVVDDLQHLALQGRS